MPRINVVKVLIGGLVAGVVANALDYVINTYLLATEMTEMVQRLNLRADVVEGSMYTWIGFDFVYGLLVVFTYAAMRPRFGPGPKTALIAGMCYWVGFTGLFAGLTAMGLYTHPAFIKSAAFSLASSLVPALVGGAIYTEAE
jgi:hypothetical protein